MLENTYTRICCAKIDSNGVRHSLLGQDEQIHSVESHNPISDIQGGLETKPLTVALQHQRLKGQYNYLLQVGRDRRERLRDSVEAYQLVREANDLHQQVVVKELVTVTETIIPGRLEEVEPAKEEGG
ncbi:unnamed protein product [Schistosoma turkestanicum]|nr:unnamed protein product [Schistosoma turkestanicum]